MSQSEPTPPNLQPSQHNGNRVSLPMWVVNLASGLLILMVMGAMVTILFVVLSVFALFAGQAASRKQLEKVDIRLKKIDKAVKEGVTENKEIPR